MKKNILLIGVSILSLAAAVMPLAAQTNTPAPPPAQLDTNLLADLGSNAPAPFKALLNLLPAWDPTLTNTFGSGELFISATPLWKSQTASGSTPYLSTSGGYYATRNLGLEAELVTLGGGNGQSTIDSGAVMGMFRKDVGNIAAYGLFGPSRDFHAGKWGLDIGGGIAYRYRTGFELFTDTRWCYQFGNSSEENSFLTRAGLRLVF